jgi:hypothetical protein
MSRSYTSSPPSATMACSGTALLLLPVRATAQAVNRTFLTTEIRVRVQVSPCGISGGQSGTGTGFALSFLVFPVYIIPPCLHTHISFWGN